MSKVFLFKCAVILTLVPILLFSIFISVYFTVSHELAYVVTLVVFAVITYLFIRYGDNV